MKSQLGTLSRSRSQPRRDSWENFSRATNSQESQRFLLTLISVFFFADPHSNRGECFLFSLGRVTMMDGNIFDSLALPIEVLEELHYISMKRRSALKLLTFVSCTFAFVFFSRVILEVVFCQSGHSNRKSLKKVKNKQKHPGNSAIKKISHKQWPNRLSINGLLFVSFFWIMS